jgi:hypothetical protein
MAVLLERGSDGVQKKKKKTEHGFLLSLTWTSEIICHTMDIIILNNKIFITVTRK